MPRISRITWLKQPHLILAYANSGNTIFYDEEDYESYLNTLRQIVKDKLARVHAFCLQTKEIRLLITPLQISISKVMQRLHASHSMRMNSKRQQKGHIFHGRFKSIVIPEKDLMTCVRSIHLWPVRDGLVRRTQLYPFSSHRAYLEEKSIYKDIVYTKEILEKLSPNYIEARRAFETYVESAALDEDDLGVDEFFPGIGATSKQSAMELYQTKYETQTTPQKRTSLRILSKRIALLLNTNVSYLSSPIRRQDLVMGRRLLATIAVMEGARSVTDVAIFLKRDKAQISRLVSQGIDLLNHDATFQILYASAQEKPRVSHDVSQENIKNKIEESLNLY